MWEAEQDRLAERVRSLPHPCGEMACNEPRGQNMLAARRRTDACVPDEVAVLGGDNDEPICAISA